jgi:hypothetical protein
MASDIDLIWVNGEAKNFLMRDWTGQITLNRFNKFRFARNRHGPHAARRYAGLERK